VKDLDIEGLYLPTFADLDEIVESQFLLQPRKSSSLIQAATTAAEPVQRQQQIVRKNPEMLRRPLHDQVRNTVGVSAA
jgi:hypothetical protein